MSGLPVEERSSSKSPRRKRSAVALLSFGLVLLMTQTGKGQTPNPLKFFKNYFVTGNYFVYGVPLKGTGVNGLATGTITVPANSVPAGGQAIAAHWYWSSVVTLADPDAGLVGAKFKGHDISGIGETLTPAGTSPCWAEGGGTGNSQGSKILVQYHADVLQFFDQDSNGEFDVKPPTKSSFATAEAATQRRSRWVPVSSSSIGWPLSR